VVTALNFPASYYEGLAAEYAARATSCSATSTDRASLHAARGRLLRDGRHLAVRLRERRGVCALDDARDRRRAGAGLEFLRPGENRYIRLNFAKKPATLHAAGERLLNSNFVLPRS
jgi:aminotransferase